MPEDEYTAMTDGKTGSRFDFTNGSIIKKLALFTVPIFAALVLQAMYGAADLAVVGRFGTTAGISAVSTGSNVLHFITMVICTLTTGVTVQIGRCLGERRPDRIGGILGAGAALFALIAAVLCVMMISLARPIALAMQSPPEAVGLTALYIKICGAGIFFIVAYNVISAVFRGLGDSTAPLLFVAAACCVNIILDMIFVAGLGMNVAGAALATVMSQAFSVFLSLLMMRKKRFGFSMPAKEIRFGPNVRDILKVSIPLAFQEVLTQSSFMALAAFINRLGLAQSSGYGVANKTNVFVMIISDSIAQSMASFVAQNAGAGKERRCRQAAYIGMAAGFASGAAACLAITFFGDKISMIFTHDPSVIEQSWAYLRGFAPEAALTGILFSFIGYFNGHRQTVFVMLQGFIPTFLVRLPLAYCMSIRENASLTDIGRAAPIATCFGIALNIAYFVYCSKKLKKPGADIYRA